jgi:hypothetical protein
MASNTLTLAGQAPFSRSADTSIQLGSEIQEEEWIRIEAATKKADRSD